MKNKKSRVVILTGPIASGKSIVRDLFNQLDVPSIDADKIVHLAYSDQTSGMYQAVVQKYGLDILDDNLHISRSKLKDLMCSGKDLKELQQLTSPHILEELLKWTSEQNNKYVLWEVPLYSREWYPDAHVVVVYVHEQRQQDFFKTRDSGNLKVLDIIKQNQKSTQQYIDLADDVINNDSTRDNLHKQVVRIHNKLMEL